MPTVLRSGPYRLYFWSHEPNEAPHVHVERDDRGAKFWLEPVALAQNFGFSPLELMRLERLIHQRQAELSRSWHDYFRT